jgi:excisionase family DNA binding protein
MELIGTFEAAKYCGVTYSTISRWIDSGKIKAFRTEGGHRKIVRKDLIKFMKSRHIPLDEILAAGKNKVVIVEDDPEMIKVYKDIFKKDKLTIEVAESGFKAGALIASVQPHLVILDIKLPDVDGREVCAFVRGKSDLSDTKILAVSALNRKKDIDEAFGAGVDDYLTKPFEAPELRKKVFALLDMDESMSEVG